MAMRVQPWDRENNFGRLQYFTPLRYPGGKAKLSPFVKKLIETSNLSDGQYVEPYAGGAGLALELLLHEYVSHIYINDISKPIYAFWDSVLNHTEKLCRLIYKTPVTVDVWEKQKKIFSKESSANTLKLGFATFFLNRTNRSGILSGGIIGGKKQNGPWKIDARYNNLELIRRIQAIANMKARISLTCEDAKEFIAKGKSIWPKKTLIYLDPPYYKKEKNLYHHTYKHEDHEIISNIIRKNRKQHWLVSYDNVPQIRRMYSGHKRLSYNIGYTVRKRSVGQEVMFFCDSLNIPPVTRQMQEVSRNTLKRQ